MVLSLLQNIAFLVALCVVHQVIVRHCGLENVKSRVLSGLLFGLMGILGMMMPLRFAPGVIFDGRSIILSVAGLFGGPVVGSIAAGLCGTYRLWLGGGGVWMGVMVILESVAVGVAFHFLRRRDARVMRVLPLCGFGFLVHVLMLLLMMTLPGRTRFQALSELALPVLLLYPLATVLICWLLNDQEERLEAEKGLQESEEKYRILVENAGEAIFVIQDGMPVYANRRCEEISGYSRSELTAMPFTQFVYAEDCALVAEHHAQRLENGCAPSIYAFRIVRPSGQIRWVELKGVVIAWKARAATLNFMSDITERQEAEARLKASLEEKTVLLREIHHRVKNNMQIISSLLHLQAARLEEKGAVEAFDVSCSRIKAMALVHETLYHSEDTARIDLSGYTRTLAENLLFSMDGKGSGVELDIQSTAVFLPLDRAVPCGLVINELISNALKHAFAQGANGRITIGIACDDAGRVTLQVGDNGKGLPRSVDFRNTNSLGLRLVVGIVEQQLGGTVELLHEGIGTAFVIRFNCFG